MKNTFFPSTNAQKWAISVTGAFLLCFSASAAITTFAEYQLGESGTVGVNNRPQDTSGNGFNFGGNFGTNASVVASDSPATSSTEALDFDGGGYTSANFSSLATDNFAIGLYVNPDTSGLFSTIFTTGNGGNAMRLRTTAGGEFEATSRSATIGTASFTTGTWYHLAIIRQSGTSTFYLDGSAVASDAVTANPIHSSSAHIGITPGGGGNFDGKMDEVRVVEFGAADSTGDILSALGYVAIPEPSTLMLVGVSLISFCVFRRRFR